MLPLVENDRMSGWEINEYTGIDALKFNDNIKLPVIQNSTDVLIEVYVTSVNPLDQLMTGLICSLISYEYMHFIV